MKNTLDFYKIDDGILGVINFNNMIIVNSNNYELLALDSEEIKYRKLLLEQLDYLNKNYFQVISESYKLYNLYINNKLPMNIKNRCCNFPLLEVKCNDKYLLKRYL